MTQSKIIPANIEMLDELLSWICGVMGAANLDSGLRHKILVASEEIFVNIASYGYPCGEGLCAVSFSHSSAEVRLEFVDSGVPFNPIERGDPDTGLKLEDRPIGGLGIFMVRKFMDDIIYRYEGGKNILTIVKKLD